MQIGKLAKSANKMDFPAVKRRTSSRTTPIAAVSADVDAL
jgi:hypothetical protein